MPLVCNWTVSEMVNPFTHGHKYTRVRIPLMNAQKRVYSRLQLFLFTNKRSACYLLMTEWKTAPMVQLSLVYTSKDCTMV